MFPVTSFLAMAYLGLVSDSEALGLGLGLAHVFAAAGQHGLASHWDCSYSCRPWALGLLISHEQQRLTQL